MNAKTFARKALLTTVLVGSLGGVGAGIATASTTDATLYGDTRSDYKASCSYSADATWDRAANRLTGHATVQSHLAFGACRNVVVVTLTDSDGVPTERRFEVPTAAATTDPSAPSRIDIPLLADPAVGKRDVAFIDHIEVRVDERTK